MIPYEDLRRLNAPFVEAFKSSFNSLLEKGYYILGGELEQFEEEFAAYATGEHCVGVSNGLDAIALALKACNLPDGSEVIVPSHTYIATILAILQCNLKPVMVDVDLATYNIDPDKIEAAITSETGAILVVHLYGRCCEMDKIMAIKQKHGLYLIEDCAQAHGATYKNQQAGTFGEFGAFSFYPTKNLGALGDAGAITCKTEQHSRLLKQLRNYGSNRKYYHDVIGYNNRLDDVQAGFLRIKLKHLDQMNRHRNELAALYQSGLSDHYIKPVVDKDYYHVFHIFNIRHPERDKLQQYLTHNGIGTVIHYPVALQRQKSLQPYFEGESYPAADEIADTTLSLPCSFSHTKEEILQVIEALNNYPGLNG